MKFSIVLTSALPVAFGAPSAAPAGGSGLVSRQASAKFNQYKSLDDW